MERLREREERKIRENNIRKRQEDVEHKTSGQMKYIDVKM